MKVWLRNITQCGLARTILLFVLGAAMWIPSFIQEEKTLWVVTTLLLHILNSLLLMRFFYRSKITSLPSLFVVSSYWFALSAIPALHICWQAQLVIAGVQLVNLLLLKLDYQHEATEEAFLATLILCVVAVIPSVLYTGILLLWGYLIAKKQMTWRVWLASLMAIAVRVILMVILHYFGWMEYIWMENIPHMTGLQWAVFGGVWLLTNLAILLPYRKPSVASGVLYLTTIAVLIIANAIWNILCLQYNYPIQSLFT